MSNCDHIVIDLNQHILHIGLNRPEKKNALTPAMYQAITAALLEADKNTDIKCVFLHGTADCFSAGSDLSGFDNRDPNQPSPGFGVGAGGWVGMGVGVGVAVGVGVLSGLLINGR